MHSLGAVFAAAATLLPTLSHASNLTPPVLPLVVRNPYLSTWLANARDEPWSKWPMFYTGQEMGMSVLASVPDSSIVYPLLGRAQDSLDGESSHYNLSFPIYHGAQFDASTTNLSYSIPSPDKDGDAAELTLSFLSPITPTSTLRQSIPASYLSVHVSGNFDLDVYIDVNGQWVSGDRGSDIVWSLEEMDFEDAAPLKSWKVKRKNEKLLTELADRAEWGTLYFTGPEDVRHECGTSGKLRHHFGKTGKLQNAVDEEFRPIMEEEPVFAFSKRFNLSSNDSDSAKKSDSALFTITHIQDPVTQFASARGLTYMRALWQSYFFTDLALITFHYEDYPHAFKLSSAYSSKLASDAETSGGESYPDIVALSARQVMGATSFSGTPDNPILFLKEISSNGNSQTIDVIFPAFPFFLYTNPRWLAYLLEPLLEHMLSGQYPNDYAMHDLGTHFPNLTGHADGNDEYMPVEECGDMLIMGLALVQTLDSTSSSDAWYLAPDAGSARVPLLDDDKMSVYALSALTSHAGIPALDAPFHKMDASRRARKWLSRSYKLWKQWTRYLVDYSLYPSNQLSTDDFAGWLALQTNLALKGIVGIRAMAGLAEVVGESEDVKYYLNVSESYVKTWEEEGMARDGGRAKLAYNWFGSWTTLYSLYGDAVLCFHPSLTANASVVSNEMQMHKGGQVPIQDGNGARKTGVKNDFIPDRVYKTQSQWYDTAMQKYGLPLDSRHQYTKSDWQLQSASVASSTVRKTIISRMAQWLNETKTDRPFSDLYKVEEGGGFPDGGPAFFARPVVGSHFSLLTVGEGHCS